MSAASVPRARAAAARVPRIRAAAARVPRARATAAHPRDSAAARRRDFCALGHRGVTRGTP
jgi:hypothetical protein